MAKAKMVLGLRDRIDALLSPLILYASRVGVTPNHVTFSQIPFYVAMFWFLVSRDFPLAIASFAAGYFLDILDGNMARVTKSATHRGHVYDKAVDLFGIYAFLLGMGIAYTDLATVAVMLGVINAALYITNELVQPEYYCCIRPAGFVALLTSVKLLLLAPALLGTAMLTVKAVRFQARRRAAGGQRTSMARLWSS